MNLNYNTMKTRIEMYNNLDSILMTVITVGLYVMNKILIDLSIITDKIISDGTIGIAVLISAISTAILNGYKFYQQYKENKKSKTPKNNA
jgi:hypothetical protein